MIDIKSYNKEELREYLLTLGEKKFRSDQLYDWMHVKLAGSFDEMTNLSKTLRERLKAECDYTKLEIVRLQESKTDGTKKFLFKLADANLIESVLMPYEHGYSVCISSQVGCRMGCRFCASTLDGLSRNLAVSEMLEQVYEISRHLRSFDANGRVHNIVMMGCGEPLDNYENAVKFVRMISDENGLHISQRNLTMSTCGLADRIRDLAKEQLQITLALSLHATTDENRRQLMPIANKYSIAELMAALDDYFDETGRRLTFEYSLVSGVNDTPEDAKRLAGLAGPRNCHVNLIPVNPIKERDYKRPDRSYVLAFKNKLEKYHINVTIRREMGADIDGACGQLRKRQMDESGQFSG
ncbi:MAG: 23S rRNA (adenine(2503)-C(2))-methyltransferase RlmN [Lachnospiraceae bacterium]|nr:23S rRNA (adenine(2503)-C(2))-methyltransferase RlmN [Lachnospiraceae bacterium]